MSVLKAENIVAGYEPDLPILNGTGFELHAREIVALLGPNGAGKSTLIKAVAGLVPISSGSVTLGGQEITRLPPHLLIRRGLGFVPQTENVFGAMSIDDNLKLAAAKPAVELVGAPDRRLFREVARNRRERVDQRPALERSILIEGGEAQMLDIERNAIAERDHQDQRSEECKRQPDRIAQQFHGLAPRVSP